MWARLRSTGTRNQRGGRGWGRCKTTCGAPGERRNHGVHDGEGEPKLRVIIEFSGGLDATVLGSNDLTHLHSAAVKPMIPHPRPSIAECFAMARPDQGIPLFGTSGSQPSIHRDAALTEDWQVRRGLYRVGKRDIVRAIRHLSREFAEVRTFPAVGRAPISSASSTSRKPIAARALA